MYRLLSKCYNTNTSQYLNSYDSYDLPGNSQREDRGGKIIKEPPLQTRLGGRSISIISRL